MRWHHAFQASPFPHSAGQRLRDCRRLTGSAPRHVLSAARRLAELDGRQVDAVSARIELDLRIGYAFTRFMTNSLRPLGGPMENLTLSYGM